MEEKQLLSEIEEIKKQIKQLTDQLKQKVNQLDITPTEKEKVQVFIKQIDRGYLSIEQGTTALKFFLKFKKRGQNGRMGKGEDTKGKV